MENWKNNAQFNTYVAPRFTIRQSVWKLKRKRMYVILLSIRITFRKS